MNIKHLRVLNKAFGKDVVHVEASHIDRVYELLLAHVKKRQNVKCYALTPVNYELAGSQFGCKRDKRAFDKILAERYG